MRTTVASIVAAALMAGTAAAQTPSPTPTSKSLAAKPARAPVVRTAKSLDCSKQADAKVLHGKPRKSFMSACKKA